ncbi:hypothetical protein KC19_12G104000 [Ceratodon purpureus]|uniref:Uncharacterized protein n=1 Tax=Ceratodon purpureus TaxID=3225 RepID=A0A8T0GBF7_CERPU|nr:hypothetical protein KC19_12G104000 [Ceratodon purpureus]
MAASASHSANVTALEAEEDQATISCSPFVTAQIELSKRHWSEMAEPSDGISMEEEAAIKLENEESFKTLEMHPEWGGLFFKTFGDHSEVRESAGSLEVGEKFAEGAQAELFHARVLWRNPKLNEEDEEKGYEWVVKVFKKGTFVRHLQQQWPESLLQLQIKSFENDELGKPQFYRHYSEVYCATLLEDGRFAFLMVKEDEDLRTLIDRKMMESDHGCGPFSK